MNAPIRPALIVATAMLAVASDALAGGPAATLHCRSAAGAATVGVRPGQSFTVSVELESAAPIAYNSAVFRVVLTRGGIAVNDYEWTDPFVTGGPLDFSLLGMQLPEVVDADTLAGPTYPAGVIDVEFASFLASGEAQEGPVVEVELRAPSDMRPGDTFQVVAVPDTFAYGFMAIPTETATVLMVRATYSPDLDGSGNIDGVDLAALLASWGSPGSDLNGDAMTDAEDLAVLLAAWS